MSVILASFFVCLQKSVVYRKWKAFRLSKNFLLSPQSTVSFWQNFHPELHLEFVVDIACNLIPHVWPEIINDTILKAICYYASLIFRILTWQVIQFSRLQIGHLKELTSSVTKQNPWQSGVLQWKEFLADTWASFKDFCWCFSYTALETNWKWKLDSAISDFNQ